MSTTEEESVLEGWFVLKFGGTSVSTQQSWNQIATIVEEHLRRGHRLLVVCSALSGVSRKLKVWLQEPFREKQTLEQLQAMHLQFAAGLGLPQYSWIEETFAEIARLVSQARQEPLPACIQAEVMAKGELLSSRLGSEWLSQRGLPVAWLDARDWLQAIQDPTCPDSRSYLSATCSYAPDRRLRAHLNASNHRVFLTQGFVGRHPHGNTVVLGRGGSDTSAAYFAAKIGAQRLEIWSDVPGMFTAHPQRYPAARLLRTLSYAEAEALSTRGGRALHPRCLQPLREAGIPLRMGWTHHPHVPGTWISAASQESRAAIKGVSARQLYLLSLQREPSWQPIGFMAEVAACFQKHQLSMDLVSSAPSRISVTIDPAVCPETAEALDMLLADLANVGTPSLFSDVASVSLVGHNVNEDIYRLGGALQQMRHRPMHLSSHAADHSHVSYVVDARDCDEWIQTFHQTLFERSGLCSRTFGPSWRALHHEPTRSLPPTHLNHEHGWPLPAPVQITSA